MRKQISISLESGNLWDRLNEARRLTGLPIGRIGREVLEMFLDVWLDIQLEIKKVKTEAIARKVLQGQGKVECEGYTSNKRGR
jgi:hypothetical protein